jgi:hypothetical protein
LHRHYERTQEALDRYPARIVTIRADASDTDDGVVVVKYGGVDGLRIPIRVHDVDEWTGRRRVTILVDPEDRGFVTLPGENFLPEWFVGRLAVGIVLAVTLLVVGTIVWARSAMFLWRRSRSPWVTAYGSAIAHRRNDSTGTYAYFRAFTPDVVWKVPSRFAIPPIVAELTGDRTGAVIRKRGEAREHLATPFPLEAHGGKAIPRWERRTGLVGVRVGAVVYETEDEEFVGLVDELAPGVTCTLLMSWAGVGVILLSDESRAVLVRKVDPNIARTRWSELVDRS